MGIVTVVAAVAGTVGAIVSVATFAIVVLIARSNLDTSHTSMEKTKTKLEELSARIEVEFQRYWFPQKKYDEWLRSRQNIISECNELDEKFLRSKDTWVVKFYHFTALSNDINENCKRIDKVIEEGEKVEVALEKRNTAPRVIKRVASISIANISSFTEKMKELLLYVKDGRYNTIRVEGDPGVGKTLLIKHFNNLEEAHKLFDIIIWVTASDFENRDHGISIDVGIQRIVAGRLGMCITDIQDVEFIASKIRAELDGAKYLLLLDDVKVNINLATIGIPTDTQGSKIVYTTNIGVFPFGVAPNHQCLTIRMEKLTEDDSLQIFEDITSRHNELFQRRPFRIIARRASKLCGGLISVIKIVAENFKDKTTEDGWNNCFEMLQTKPEIEGMCMEAQRYYFNFSYGNLDEKKKKCFLFCLLYPEDNKIPVNCLFDCWAADNLLPTRALGRDTLNHLIKMALLKKDTNKQYVTIDKVRRDAAMTILQDHKEFKCLIAQEAKIKVQKNDCKNIRWISLANSRIDILRTGVYCPRLTTLFLQKNSDLKTIPSSFFKDVTELLVLDLYKTGLESVFPMSDLQKLKVLYVNGCAKLKELPFKIEDLDHMLEVLDVRGCIINEIPNDIKMLKNLRRLIVSIDPQAFKDLNIRELSLLNELIIDVKSVYKDEVIEDVLEKIDTLEKLTTLKVHFEDQVKLEDDIVDIIQVRGQTLRVFVPKQDNLKYIWKEGKKHYDDTQLYIGSQMTSTDKIPKEFPNSFVVSRAKIVSGDVIKEVLVKVKALIVIKENSMLHLHEIETKTSQPSMLINHVHHCLLQGCNKIETLMQTVYFMNLKTLVLTDCSKLEVLFSDDVRRQQMFIEHLEIRDCPAITEINMLSLSTTGGDILPELKTLVVHNLPKLKKICYDMERPTPFTLQKHMCPELIEQTLSIIIVGNVAGGTAIGS